MTQEDQREQLGHLEKGSIQYSQPYSSRDIVKFTQVLSQFVRKQ